MDVPNQNLEFNGKVRQKCRPIFIIYCYFNLLFNVAYL